MSDPASEPAQQAPLTPDEVAAIATRLDAMDQSRPWTRAALQLIATNEDIDPTDLAERLGREVGRLKTDVRRLRALGLTARLDTGYRVTPRGAAFIASESPPA